MTTPSTIPGVLQDTLDAERGAAWADGTIANRPFLRPLRTDLGTSRQPRGARCYQFNQSAYVAIPPEFNFTTALTLATWIQRGTVADQMFNTYQVAGGFAGYGWTFAPASPIAAVTLDSRAV